MEKPLVSCIIPVYNASQYLHRCIDSVLAQSYSNLEVVLVDDGSTDNSGAICDEYASKCDNIRVHHLENGGASLARQYGLKASLGEYVSFVDSDDYISPNYIQVLLTLVKQHDVPIAACNVTRTQPGEMPQWPTTSQKSQLLNFEELMPRFFKYEFWGFPGKLYKRKLFDTIEFPHATLSEDYMVMTQIFSNTRYLAVTDSALYAYEYHSSSLSHTALSSRAFEEFENVTWVLDYVDEHFPEYMPNALSNAVETCVKLYMRKPLDKKHQYSAQFNNILTFLRNRRRAIKINSFIPKNVRRLAVAISYVPNLTLIANRFLSFLK